MKTRSVFMEQSQPFRMAQEYCRRGTLYYRVCIPSDDDPHVFTAAEIASYPMLEPWTQFVLDSRDVERTYARASEVGRFQSRVGDPGH